MIMISGCLLGINCKYNGGNNLNPKIMSNLRGKPLIVVCPEAMGGLSIPRSPCEIQGGDGHDVLAGRARVVSYEGHDVTRYFLDGAFECLRLARLNDVKVAVLKKRSPSCGNGKIYDGTFSSVVVDGDGVTAALLKSHGIEILDEENFFRARDLL